MRSYCYNSPTLKKYAVFYVVLWFGSIWDG